MSAKIAARDRPSVPAWLLLGSFPAPERRPSGWLFDGPSGEPDFRPRAGDRLAGRRWVPFVPSTPFVDFLQAPLSHPASSWCYAYALTYFYAPRRQRARWLAGSDDGLAVWLDGELVHSYDGGRALTMDQDTFVVTLEPGWHTLLCKVTQHELNWALSLRWDPSAPDATRGLRFSLRPPPLHQFAFYRRATGRFRFRLRPRVEMVGTEDWLCRLRCRLFLDATLPARQVRMEVLDATRQVLAAANPEDWAAFTTREVTFALCGTAFLAALASGRHDWRLLVHSSLGRQELTLDAGIFERPVSRALLGLDTPATPDATFRVPDIFRGAPATVRLVAQSGAILPRELPWPDLPSREVSPRETATGRVRVRLTVPTGLPALMARLVFGTPQQCQRSLQLATLLDTTPKLDPAVREHLRAAMAAVAAGKRQAFFQALERAYRAFAPPTSSRHRGQVTLVGHAHIDMNWLWTTPETIQCCHDTFRQALAFMEEFPTFCFSQSQAAVYRFIEQTDPVMFRRIRQRVAEGRWELLGGMVTEGDTNLASGEGLARSLLLGQRYFRSRFGRLARVGWLPDNFGHAAQLPQLLRQAGLRYFYAHRCQPQLGPYVWMAPDGSTVLVFVTETYNAEVGPELRTAPGRYNPINGRVLCVYGVGDHGGGPTRRDVRRALEYAALLGFPKIELGTAERFFRTLESDRQRYPVYRGERQYVYEGCYSSLARLKGLNRRCENALYLAELLVALTAAGPRARALAGRLRAAWEAVTFNQFHDILCGSAVHESNLDSQARYGTALEEAEKIAGEGLRSLATALRTRAGRGQPVVVFNPLPRRRTDVVEVELFSALPPPTARLRSWTAFRYQPVEPVDTGKGPFATLRLVDERNRPVNAQIVDGKLFPNGYRLRARFVAQDVPPCGTRLFYARPTEPGSITGPALKVGAHSFDTPLLTVAWHPLTGHLTRLYDKQRRREWLSARRPANVLRLDLEAPHGMSAWELGPIQQSITLDHADSLRVTEAGPVRAVLEAVRTWERSTFTQRLIVYRDLPRVDFELEVVWYQLGNQTHGGPSLRVSFPVNVRRGRFFCDTPFAAVERPPTGREVPAQQWTDLSGPAGGLALLNDGIYGHRCLKDVLEMTLLRASYDPDLYPDQGVHRFRYSLVPHAGDHRSAGVLELGQAFNQPLRAVEIPLGTVGQQEAGAPLLTLAPAGVYLSAVKLAEDGRAMVVRIFEGQGRSALARLTFARPVRAVERVDLLEMRRRDGVQPRTTDRTVHIGIRPHEIISLRLRLA